MHDGMPDTVRVWDPLVRVFHWSLATAVFTAWFTEDGPGWLHDNAGYIALGLVAFRLVWGLVGTRYARFSEFVRSPRATLGYAADLVTGGERHYLGHNPLGGWMIVALLGMVAVTGTTGWLYTTDAFWGVKWMEELHEICANSLIFLVALHVAGVVFTSWRERENLVRAMLTGRKRAESGR
jgi:cytochrome b